VDGLSIAIQESDSMGALGLLAARQEHFLQAVGFYKKALALNPEMPVCA